MYFFTNLHDTTFTISKYSYVPPREHYISPHNRIIAHKILTSESRIISKEWEICYSRNNITLGLYNTFAEVFGVCFCQKHVPVKCNCHIPPLNPSFRSLLLFHRTPIQFPCNMKRVWVWNQSRQKNPPPPQLRTTFS